jgi:hypothetical protein
MVKMAAYVIIMINPMLSTQKKKTCFLLSVLARMLSGHG